MFQIYDRSHSILELDLQYREQVNVHSIWTIVQIAHTSWYDLWSSGLHNSASLVSQFNRRVAVISMVSTTWGSLEPVLEMFCVVVWLSLIVDRMIRVTDLKSCGISGSSFSETCNSNVWSSAKRFLVFFLPRFKGPFNVPSWMRVSTDFARLRSVMENSGIDLCAILPPTPSSMHNGTHFNWTWSDIWEHSGTHQERQCLCPPSIGSIGSSGAHNVELHDLIACKCMDGVSIVWLW